MDLKQLASNGQGAGTARIVGLLATKDAFQDIPSSIEKQLLPNTHVPELVHIRKKNCCEQPWGNAMRLAVCKTPTECGSRGSYFVDADS